MSGYNKEHIIATARSVLGQHARQGKHFFLKRDNDGPWIWGLIPRGKHYPWEGQFQSRAEVDEYFSKDEIVCLLCGAPFLALGNHLRAAHKMNSKEYQDRYDLPRERGLAGASTLSKTSSRPFPEKSSAHMARLHAGAERFRRSGSGSHQPRWALAERGRHLHAAVLRARLQKTLKQKDPDGKALFERIRKAVPAALPDDIRQEIVQEVAIAVCAGTLPRQDLEKSIPNFIMSFNRANRGKFTDVSMDTPLYDDGTTTLGDRIASDAFHF